MFILSEVSGLLNTGEVPNLFNAEDAFEGRILTPCFSGTRTVLCYWVGGLSRLTLCKVVSRGRAHGDSAYKLVRASSWKSSHPGKHMGIPN